MTYQTGDAGVVRTQNARQGLLSPLNRGRNFPHDIAVAIVAITTGSAFHDLPRNARSVLAFAVRVAERKDPTKPSWAFKKTIAKEIGISESTVYRVLNVLVDNGFIERFEQERKAHNGKLAGARIALTRKTCVSLGLMVIQKDTETIPQPEKKESQASPESGAFHFPPSVKLQGGYKNTLLLADQRTQSLQKHSPGTSPRTVIDKPLTVRTKVPEELFWLIEEKNLTQPQVFLLMREFGQRQQRLSDAVEVTRKRIEQLGNREVFRYLRALAKAPTDFSWIRKQREQSLRAVQRDNHRREVNTELLNRMNGNFLVSTNGESVHQIDATTQTAEVWWREEGTGRIRNGQAPINAAYVEALAAGRLKPIDREKAEALISSWTTASAGSRRIH